MLAKEIKIRNLKRQREYIISQLNKLLERQIVDGDTAYPYVGYIFPEVIEYLQKEGFNIEKHEPKEAMLKGRPIYLITVRDDIVLTDEEKEAAENVENAEDEDMDMMGSSNPMDDLMGLLGR